MTAVGTTLGVEEEFHLVDADTLALADAPDAVPAARARLGDEVQSEISTSQLELATHVCGSLAEVRTELGRLRAGAAAAVEEVGCRLLACGTHPFSSWHDQRLTDDDRYREVADRLGLLALQQLIAGCHVHVGVPDPETAVRVLDRLRPDLPVLLALAGSSPFWEGVDTGYASYRSAWFGRFPIAGPPPLLGDAAGYQRVVADLVATGVVRDASHLYWDARPSLRFPTVEVRVADTLPSLDDVVLHVALVRSLVRLAAADAERDVPFAQPRAELVRAAMWRAARDGDVVDLRDGGTRPAADAVSRLLARLRPDLEELGDWDEVAALAYQLLSRGTSAARQRRVLTGGGDLRDVAASVLADSSGA